MLEMEERRETERIEVKQSIKKGRGTSREGGGLGDCLWVVQCSPWYVAPPPPPPDAILQEFFFIDFQYLVDLPEDQAVSGRGMWVGGAAVKRCGGGKEESC